MTREEAINILDRRTTIPGDGFTWEQITEAINKGHRRSCSHQPKASGEGVESTLVQLGRWRFLLFFAAQTAQQKHEN